MHLRQFAQTNDRRIADRVDDGVENPASAWTVHGTCGGRRIHLDTPVTNL
jgi:hypothetical protein